MTDSLHRCVGFALLSLCVAAGPSTAPVGLRNPAAKDVAMQLVSAAENSSLKWRDQYGYIEYNVEHNANENRGYTGGIIGFTSRTHDMLDLVRRYEHDKPNNPLSPYLPALKKADNTASRRGLGQAFMKAWNEAAKDPAFCAAQDAERDRVYFDPAVDLAVADGLHELGQFCYYDAIVMHGDGDDGLGGIRAAAMRVAKPPAQGGDETAYLNAFLDARVVAMKKEQGHQDTTRVDTAQRAFLKAGNLTLRPPLVFQVYGEEYRIGPAK